MKTVTYEELDSAAYKWLKTAIFLSAVVYLKKKL